MYEVSKIDPYIPARYVGIGIAVASSLLSLFWLVMESSLFRRADMEEIIVALVVPLVCGFVAFVSTIVAILIYNVIAKQYHGVKLELEFTQDDKDTE